MGKLFLAFAFCACVFVGCESSASKSTVRTDPEGKISSEVVKHEVKTDLPVEKWGDKLLEGQREEELGKPLTDEGGTQ